MVSVRGRWQKNGTDVNESFAGQKDVYQSFQEMWWYVWSSLLPETSEQTRFDNEYIEEGKDSETE